jgi:signal transduction histidine kinase
MLSYSPFSFKPIGSKFVGVAIPEDSISDIYKIINQQLNSLVQHSGIDGVCVVWHNGSNQRQTAFSGKENLTVCPLPPLPRIEAMLAKQWDQYNPQVQDLGTQVIQNYGLYGYWLGNNDHPAYLLAWHSVDLLPCQRYMLQQQAMVVNLSMQKDVRLSGNVPKLEPPVSQQVLRILQDTEHQLRTPLSLIKLYADLLGQQLPNDGKKAQLNCIQSTVATLESTLKQLTQGQLHTAPQRHHADVKLLLLDVLETLQPLLDRKEINLCLDLQSCPIDLDVWQIRQVLQNILDNAIFFTPKGTTITCRCRQFQTEVLIQIADQGGGLSTQDRHNLFQVNYSRRSGGTGMGLAIAKQIIQHHAGNIWAENLPTQGAQFSITLPC